MGEQVEIKIMTDSGGSLIKAEKGSLLLYVLNEAGIKLNTVCGGSGRCGKCAVKVLGGSIDPTPDDKRIFSEKQLSEGCRLSCRAVVKDDLSIRILRAEEKDMIAALSDTGQVEAPGEGEKTFSRSNGAGIAIDIGTTTLALSLVDLTQGTVPDTVTSVNPQRSLGSDVISRIDAATSGRAAELKSLISGELCSGIKRLMERNRITAPSVIRKAAIAGNTAMLHLLTGYPVKGLSAYPFTPVNLSLEKRPLEELIPGLPEKLKNVTAFLLPGASAFIGADIISGLYSLGFHEKDGISALIDLGTNGEMVIGNREKLLAASAAAGPAFEGGSITWGSAGIPGAISKVEIKGDKAAVETLGNREFPLGICGTGVIETCAELLDKGLIDENGLLCDPFFDPGFPLAETKEGESIVFTQDDIREFQLAKAAIRAGFEILLKRYGAGYEDIENLYISGGFGCFLNIKKAARTGLIPEELLSKCIPCGNTSLSGTIRFLREGEAAFMAFAALTAATEVIELSNDPSFNDLYLNRLSF